MISTQKVESTLNWTMDSEMNQTISGNFSWLLDCDDLPVIDSIFTAYLVANILLLPLFSFVVFLGFQQWRKQRSTSQTAATSHADVFTYHMVAMEMIGALICAAYCVGLYIDHLQMLMYSGELLNTTLSVKILFHMLTCVELYLAVVHPVAYLQLKNSNGVRIRNISVGCVWLLSLTFYFFISYWETSHLSILNYCLVASVLVVVSFCCMCVLWTLRRPAPGDGNKQRVDRSKRRAFNTMSTIMAVLLLCFSGMLAGNALESSLQMNSRGRCVSSACTAWFTLPSSLVLPLLFLQRAGKLCKH